MSATTVCPFDDGGITNPDPSGPRRSVQRKMSGPDPFKTLGSGPRRPCPETLPAGQLSIRVNIAHRRRSCYANPADKAAAPAPLSRVRRFIASNPSKHRVSHRTGYAHDMLPGAPRI